MTKPARARYAGYRFPAEIIGHAVWLYFRFPLGLRMVEELLAARGIIVSHETVRQWARKFGQQFANLHRAGILTVAELWNATPFQLRRVWGGINGLLFHQMLHGVDIQPPSSRYSKSIGHQHVLEPELRTKKGAHDFAQHLLTKAAERLRRRDYYCRRLGAHLSWVGDLRRWYEESDFHATRHTAFLLVRLEENWQSVARC